MTMFYRPYQRDIFEERRAYRTRMTVFVLLSVLLHAGIVAAYWHNQSRTIQPPKLDDEPLVLNLQPEEQPTPSPGRQFIDAAVPTDAPDRPTRRVAEVNQRASDASEADMNSDAPDVEQGRIEDAGRMAASAPPAPQPQPQTDQSEAAEEAETEAEDMPIEETEEPIIVAANTPAPQPQPVTATPVPPTPPAPQAPMTDQSPVPPQPDTFVEREARTQSNRQGGATNLGFVGFEALQDELAPYMKIVRDRVEKKWKIAVQLRYNGTDPADAVVECAIAPTGEIAYVEILEPGKYPAFAMLCKKSMEDAGPFPPFPFEVPAIYRNDLLRIRWTFSFL